MDITIKDPINFTPLIQALWKDHYPAKKDEMSTDLQKHGWDLSEPVTVRFVEDGATAILYHGADACALLSIDYSEPCLKITYAYN